MKDNPSNTFLLPPSRGRGGRHEDQRRNRSGKIHGLSTGLERTEALQQNASNSGSRPKPQEHSHGIGMASNSSCVSFGSPAGSGSSNYKGKNQSSSKMKQVASLTHVETGSQQKDNKRQNSDVKARRRLRLKRYGLQRGKRAGTLQEDAALHVKFFDKANTNDGENLSSPYKSRIAGSIKIS